ncbi:MAG: hypothetical protein AB8I08_18480 [Sandaracinaceae bacterium]
MIRRIPLALALALSLVACGAEEADPAPETPEPAETPVAVDMETEESTEEALPDISEEEFPLAEDFEEEATAAITADNLEAELAAMEAELAE